MELLRFIFGERLIRLTDMKGHRKILDAQIEVFLEWGRRNSIASMSYKEWLDMFSDFTDKTDVMDITYEDIDLFIEKKQDYIRTGFQESNARKALEGLLRFYMARSRNGIKRLGKGRPPHIGEIEQVKKYRRMRDDKGNPLSFRAICKIMGKNISLVHKWAHYDLDKKGK